MGSEIDLVSDGGGLAVIGNSTDVERFFFRPGSTRHRRGISIFTAFGRSWGQAGPLCRSVPASRRTPDVG